MPAFTFTSPDGRKYTVNGPDGATSEQAFGILQHHIAQEKSPSMVSGAVRAAAEGVPIIGGALNKLDAATNAAIAPVINPILPDKYKLKGDTFGERYANSLREQEGTDAAFTQEHSYVATGANIAGAVGGLGVAGMTGLGARALGLGAKTLPGMIGAGAASGGVIGGLDAAVRGGDASEGALYGAAGGAAGPVIGRAIGEAAAPITRIVRGMRDPNAEAARRVAGALDRDMTSGNAGLSPAEFRGAQREGQPVGLIDAGGETTRALARSAANTSPEGRADLTRFTSDRFEGQGGRLENWLNKRFNYPDADATQRALTDVARTVNRPAYAKAYAAGANGIWSDELAQISQAPVVQDAIRKTMVSAKNEAAKMGFPAPQNPFRTDAEGRILLGADDKGQQLTPSLQFWDYVKRNLDGVGTRESKEWARVLRDHLDEHVSEYGLARAGAAKFFGAQDALEAGRNAVASRMANPDMARGVAKMTAPERKLFQDGFVDQYVRMVREAPDRRSILNKIANTPAARERINIALGPQRAREMEAFLRVESIMDRARNAVSGNSTTARQLAELGLAGGYNLYEGGGLPSQDPSVFMHTAMIYGALRGSRTLGSRIDERVAQRVARLLTSSDTKDIDQGIRLISRNQTMFKAIRNADAAMGSVATRGVVSGADEASQDNKRRKSGNVTVK